MLAFGIIAFLYVVIGLLAAAGAICLSRKLLAPRSEQVLYAIALILIAFMYLAFSSYFKATTAWHLETFVVIGFVATGFLGIRLPIALIVGYFLHGTWDLIHELHAHGAYSAFEPGQLTAIPLAYGFFCSVFDFCMAAYFYKRRAEWNAAWKSGTVV